MGIFDKKKPISVEEFKGLTVKRVGYIGLERGDIVTALALIGKSAGLKVAILDNSKRGDIYAALCDGRITEKLGITVARNYVVVSDSDYDVIFTYSGANGGKIMSDFNILAPSSNKDEVEAAKSFAGDDVPHRVIYRDENPGYRAATLAGEYKLKKEEAKEIGVLPLRASEITAWSDFARNNSPAFISKLNDKAKSEVAALAKIIYKLDDSQVTKLLAKNGIS